MEAIPKDILNKHKQVVYDDPNIKDNRQMLEAQKELTRNFIKDEQSKKGTIQGVIGNVNELFDNMMIGVLNSIKKPKSYQKKKKNKIIKLKPPTYTPENITKLLKSFHNNSDTLARSLQNTLPSYCKVRLVFPYNKNLIHKHIVDKIPPKTNDVQYCITFEEDTTYFILFSPEQKTQVTLNVKHVQTTMGSKTNINTYMGSMVMPDEWCGFKLTTTNQTQISFLHCTRPICIVQMNKKTQSNTIKNLQNKLSDSINEKSSDEMISILKGVHTTLPDMKNSPFIVDELVTINFTLPVIEATSDFEDF